MDCHVKCDNALHKQPSADCQCRHSRGRMLMAVSAVCCLVPTRCYLLPNAQMSVVLRRLWGAYESMPQSQSGRAVLAVLCVSLFGARRQPSPSGVSRHTSSDKSSHTRHAQYRASAEIPQCDRVRMCGITMHSSPSQGVAYIALYRVSQSAVKSPPAGLHRRVNAVPHATAQFVRIVA